MQLNLYNRSKVQVTVRGTDDKTYYLAPRKSSKLPEGVEISGALPKMVKVLKTSE